MDVHLEIFVSVIFLASLSLRNGAPISGDRRHRRSIRSTRIQRAGDIVSVWERKPSPSFFTYIVCRAVLRIFCTRLMGGYVNASQALVED